MLLALTAPTWSAIAAWVAIAIALVGALVARGQLAEARRLRRERSQPYVVAYVDQSPGMSDLGDLVIANLGQTAAHDVTVTFQEPLRSVLRGEHGGDDQVLVPATIPTLVPGQRWRTTWDRTTLRTNAGLSMRHAVALGCRDSTGHVYPAQTFDLDLEPIALHGHVVEHGLHDIAKTLRAIRKLMQKSLGASGSR